MAPISRDNFSKGLIKTSGHQVYITPPFTLRAERRIKSGKRSYKGVQEVLIKPF